MTPGFGRQGGHAAAETSAPIDRRSARFGIVIVGQRQEHLSNLKKSAVAILATARKAMRCVAAQRFATMRFSVFLGVVRSAATKVGVPRAIELTRPSTKWTINVPSASLPSMAR